MYGRIAHRFVSSVYDNEFNPAMDKQAMDRAHRIGQTREGELR